MRSSCFAHASGTRRVAPVECDGTGAGRADLRPAHLSRALLVNDPARVQAFAPGVPAYPWSEPFSAETLNPFFDKAEGERGGANAGR